MKKQKLSDSIFIFSLEENETGIIENFPSCCIISLYFKKWPESIGDAQIALMFNLHNGQKKSRSYLINNSREPERIDLSFDELDIICSDIVSILISYKLGARISPPCLLDIVCDLNG